MSNRRPRLQLQISERRLLILVGDIALNVLAVFLALAIWSRVGGFDFDMAFLSAQWGWFIVLPGLWVLLASMNDYYDLRVTSRLNTSMARLGRVVGQLFIAYLVLYFVSLRVALPRLFILYDAVLVLVLVGAWRIWRPFLSGWRFKRRALIIGTGWGAETIVNTLEREAPGDYEIVGLIRDEGSQPTTLHGIPTLGNGHDLPQVVRTQRVAELILTYSGSLPGDIFEGLMTCYEQGVTMVQMPILYEQMTGRVPIEHVGRDQWTVVLPMEGETVSRRLYLATKRLMDIVLALVGLLLFAIIFIPLVVIMKLDSRGPIFYQQARLGRGGRSFKVIKLRSMIPDAEKMSGPVWASKGDPRVTRVGRILRKTRLDEIPQLVNVLRGEMSMVGPRPERQHFVDMLTQEIPFYRTRLAVAPGVTGWAQVRYQYGSSTEDALIKLQYDLYYIRHQSLILDTVIILRTVGKMLAFQGT